MTTMKLRPCNPYLDFYQGYSTPNNNITNTPSYSIYKNISPNTERAWRYDECPTVILQEETEFAYTYHTYGSDRHETKYFAIRFTNFPKALVRIGINHPENAIQKHLDIVNLVLSKRNTNVIDTSRISRSITNGHRL